MLVRGGQTKVQGLHVDRYLHNVKKVVEGGSWGVVGLFHSSLSKVHPAQFLANLTIGGLSFLHHLAGPFIKIRYPLWAFRQNNCPPLLQVVNSHCL